MSDATTAAPAAAPTPDPATAPPAAAPAAATPAPSPAPAPAATPAPSPAPTPAPSPAPAPAGAPEKYADFALPEGVEASAEGLAEFGTLAKSLNLTQEQAQQLIDLNGRRAQAQSAQFKQQLTEFYSDIGGLPETWAASVAADKEIGGDKAAEHLAVAKAALDKFGTPELTAFLKKTGAEGHPEVLRAFFRVGQAISQDGFVPGRRGGEPTSLAQRMYPGMNP